MRHRLYLMNQAHKHDTFSSLIEEANHLIKHPYQSQALEEAYQVIKHDQETIEDGFVHYRTVYDESYYGPCEHALIVPKHHETTLSYVFYEENLQSIASYIKALEAKNKEHSKSLYRIKQMGAFFNKEDTFLLVPKTWVMRTLGTIAESNKQQTTHCVVYLEVNPKRDELPYLHFAKLMGKSLACIEAFNVNELGQAQEGVRYNFSHKTLTIKPVFKD